MLAKFQSDYMYQAHEDPAKIVRRARKVLADVDFDTMIGTGLSGALVVPYLARRLGKHWAIARKDGDNSHASWPIEGEVGERWIFVDDFISSGRSRDRTRGAVDRAFTQRFTQRSEEDQTHFVGSYLYNGEAFKEREDFYTPRWKRGAFPTDGKDGIFVPRNVAQDADYGVWIEQNSDLMRHVEADLPY
jgi:hypothetical protein